MSAADSVVNEYALGFNRANFGHAFATPRAFFYGRCAWLRYPVMDAGALYALRSRLLCTKSEFIGMG